MNEYLQQIFSQFRNLVLNAAGVRRDFYKLIEDKDISAAISMMQDRTSIVDEAIKEYNPQTHKVMRRPNKIRKKMEPYITEKLPRTRQRYINEVELFFLLGSKIVWKKEEGDDEAYKLFTDFLEEKYINTKLRELKRISGSETEGALVFRLYRDDNNEMQCDVFITSRSTGYKVRPLFDQYGNMVAYGYGYHTKESTGIVEHWDIMTPENTFSCTKERMGWSIVPFPNLTKKINAVYTQQLKSWDGAEARINREEFLDSKVGDTNNYFADPIAAATADVVQMMNQNNQKERIGQLIQLTGKESDFHYVNPPQNSETRRDEKSDLAESILFDTFTPDFSVEKMRGFGTLSGTAIRNAMVLGYIKRAKNIDKWGEYVARMRNIILAILCELHPEKRKDLEALKITFEFGEPFSSDKFDLWGAIANLYKSGLLSLEEAVNMLALTKAPEEEIERLKQAQQEAAMADMIPVEEEEESE